MSEFPRGRGRSASGLVLAGGASRRFGGPKPLAPFRGRPLVSRAASALEPFCHDVVISIGIDADAGVFRSAVPGARVVPDARSDQGPIEGLRRGFLAAEAPTVLVAPCDAPLLRPGLYAALLGILGEHEAAVPRWEAMDPVRAAYRREAVLRELRRDGSVASPSALVDRLDAVFLEGEALRRADPDLASFIDVNHRQDLDRIAREALRPPDRIAVLNTGS